MYQSKKEFITRIVPTLLPDLKSNERALWGHMTPQHMIEHLTAGFKMAIAQPAVLCFTPDREIPNWLGFLRGPEPFPKNIPTPGKENGELDPLENDNLDQAKTMLLVAIQAFYDYFEERPSARTTNPVFGQLGLEDWEIYQYKHLKHHLAQFGLIPEMERMQARAA